MNKNMPNRKPSIFLGLLKIIKDKLIFDWLPIVLGVVAGITILGCLSALVTFIRGY
jgi:hypothetical protein